MQGQPPESSEPDAERRASSERSRRSPAGGQPGEPG